MTRGTIYLLLPESKVIETCEFNGDMYEDGGHMTEMVDLLKGVKTKEEFKTAITKFDKDNFNYQSEKGDYFGFNDRKFSFYSELGGCVDFSREYFKYFFSDYTYFLNLSGEEVEFRLKDGGGVYLQDNKIAIFNFGNFYKPETIDLFNNVIEEEEKEEFNEELTDEDTSEIARQIEDGNTSGRVDNSDLGYSVSFELTVNKFKN